jgi:glycosyltransferase involved in cell wall biosynthesis
MKIKCFGWRHSQLDQISRIEQGFIDLGHELVDENPDLVYSNNDFYNLALEFSWKQKTLPFIISNVLDLQTDNPNYDFKKLQNQLCDGHAITSISKTTQKQLKNILGFNSTVIYNPSKPTYSLGDTNKKTFPFLYVGRANSPNKRFYLIKETLDLASWPYEYLKVCGSERPICGEYQGIVNDNQLNNLYNGAGIVLLPSSSEGIGLSFIEALQTFTPVIGCSDCEAVKEFLPECMICDPNPTQIRNKILDIKSNYDYYRQVAFEYGIKYKEQFSGKAVAQRIIDIYESSKKQNQIN